MERRLLLGITGGIAAYKCPYLIRLFKQNNIEVKVVATSHAMEFVTRVTLEALSGQPLYMDMFGPRGDSYEHIELAKWADVMVVAPTTANCAAKFANGIADDLLSALFLTFKKPVLLAPAMNTAMYIDAATTRNLRILRERGVKVIEPDSGPLACGDAGLGRMAEPEQIFERVMLMFADRDALSGKKALVTASATRERIDPVRFISNRSTGKMGYAIAETLSMYGADVTLVTGPSSLVSPADVNMVRVESAQEMYDSVMARADSSDIIIKAAAVADFTPATVSESKIKKTGEGLTLELKRTKDILASLSEMKKEGQLLIGFAAESDDHFSNAVGKLIKKKLDLIVMNDIRATDAGFGTDTNRVMFVMPGHKGSPPEGWQSKETTDADVFVRATPLLSKYAVADELVKIIIGMI